MNKKSLGSNHDEKSANGKENYFNHSIDLFRLEMLFQISRYDF